MWTNRHAGRVVTFVCLAALGCQAKPLVDFSAEERQRILQHSPLPPLPPDPTNLFGDDPAAARLGQFLFYDTRFSANGQVACATCHPAGPAWADGKQLSRGVATARRHAPTLWNTAFNRWFFWDGRADSHWAQALRPIEDPLEQGGSRLQYLHVVATDVSLRAAYERLFGPLPDVSDPARFPAAGCPMPGASDDPHDLAWRSMTEADQEIVNRFYANIGKAIAAFERRLISDNAPFDRFVAGLRDGDGGKLSALSLSAQRGLQLFVGAGRCHECHTGPNFSDGEFHSIGLAPLDGSLLDSGRYGGIAAVLADPFNAIGRYSDDPSERERAVSFLISRPDTQGQFKVPTLRNVTQTAPYMHDGRFASLTDVLHFYSNDAGAAQSGHHQETILRPLHLSDEAVNDLLAFFDSLTGAPLDPALLQQPPSPLLEEPEKDRG
jgi:cytochrome c peroxidase